MNICIITSSFPSRPDDVVQAPFVIDFIEGLTKRGHRVFVFTQDREGEKKEVVKGVNVKWFPWAKARRPLIRLNPVNPFDLLRIGSLLHNGRAALSAFVRENRMDSCLALWVLPGGYFANHAYRLTGTPYSVWALGSDIYRYGRNPVLYRMMKRIIRDAKGVFADGFDLAKRVEERFGRKCFFLATTRTMAPFAPESGEKELRSKPYQFLFVGRLEKVKGIDLLLQATARLVEDGLDVHLTVVGKGGMEEWAKIFVEQKGLGKRISMVGNVSDTVLSSLYASADCVTIPSRSESIPLVFSEALRFGKELIVTDVGDMGMLGRQYGVAGVVPPEDPMALEDQMQRKIKSRGGDRTEKEAEKREELKRLFDIETSVERFLADYK